VIDWAPLAAKLAAQLRIPLLEVRATPLAGGDINRAFRLEFGAARFFVKLNRAEWLSMFVAEAAGLEAIRRSGTIRVPEVYLTSRERNHACFVMEYIDLAGAADRDLLARQLAAMHSCYHDRFGFDGDNTIGSTPQINEFCDDWIEFWRRHRLEFQLTLARQNGCEAARPACSTAGIASPKTWRHSLTVIDRDHRCCMAISGAVTRAPMMREILSFSIRPVTTAITRPTSR